MPSFPNLHGGNGCWLGWVLALNVWGADSGLAQSRQFSQVAQSPNALTPTLVFEGNGRLFGLGPSGKLLQSLNGQTWTATPGPGTGGLTRLISDGERLLSLTTEFPLRSRVWASADGTNWTHLSDVGPSADAYGFAFGGGIYVVTGGFGVYSSTNAIDWQPRTTSTNAALYVVTYGDGLFVAAGWDEILGGVVYSSPDGRTWTRRRAAINDSYYEVCFGAGRFVVAGSRSGDTWNQLLLTSGTGTSWNAIVMENEGELYAVAFGNGRFVAVGDSGFVAVSTNGTSWAGRSLPDRAIPGQSPRPDMFWSIAFAAGGFVAATERGDIVTSADGRGWVDQTGSFDAGLSDLAYGNGLFVAAGSDGVWVSGDASTWTNVLSDAEVSYEAVAFGGGRFVVAGWDFDVNSNLRSALFLSADAVTWTRTRTVLSEDPREVTFGGGRFVVVGERTDANENLFNLVLRSGDGVSWARAGSVPENHDVPGLYDVAHNGTNFVAVGEEGLVLTSPNGDVWTGRNLGSDASLFHVAYGGGEFCAAGGSDLFRSADGVAWLPVDTAEVANPCGVVYAGGAFLFLGLDEVTVSADLQTWQRLLVQTPRVRTCLFGGASSGRQIVLVGDSGAVITSTNLVLWHRHAVSRQTTLRAMTSGAGRFVAVGEPGTFATSVDGLTWEFATRPQLGFLTSVAHGNGRFVALGPPRMQWASSDGSNWNFITNTITAPVTDVSFGHGKFAAVSTAGKTFVSENGLDWALQAAGPTVPLTAILAVPSGFIAAGIEGTVWTSANGSTWERHNVGTNADLTGVTFGLGRLLAVGTLNRFFAGTVFASTDGMAWIQSPAGFDRPQSIAFGDGEFVALGYRNLNQPAASAFSSNDGLVWQAANPVSLGAAKVVYLDRAFYAVGPFGRIYRSEGQPNPPRLGITRSLDGQQLSISLIGIPGSSYRIESKPQPGPEFSWEFVSNLTMTSAVQTILITPPAGPSRYFRAERLNP